MRRPSLRDEIERATDLETLRGFSIAIAAALAETAKDFETLREFTLAMLVAYEHRSPESAAKAVATVMEVARKNRARPDPDTRPENATTTD